MRTPHAGVVRASAAAPAAQRLRQLAAPQDSSGTTPGGVTLQIIPDAPVIAYVPAGGGYITMQAWTAGTVRNIPMPIDGRIRLRFAANDLSFPTLRARVDTMSPNIWTLVRPDREALNKLGRLSGSELRNPPTGKSTPLAAGATDSDAATCAGVLQQLAGAYGPPPPPDTSTSTTRNAILDLLEDTVDYLTDGTSQLADGMIQLGSEAGAYAGSLIDNGSAALAGVTTAVTNASSLVVSATASTFSDLVKAAAKATPRFGTGAIDTCIDSAKTLAVVAESVAGEVAHTFTIIGTTLIDGTQYVWRVVCAGVLEAIHAVKAFLRKIGAELKKIIEFIAWLFKWHDFVLASDGIYDDMLGYLREVPTRLSELGQYRSQLRQYLTIPSGIGNKSLAELAHITVPSMPGCNELEYVTELMAELCGSSGLSVDGMDDMLNSLSAAGSSSSLDLSRFGVSVGTDSSAVIDLLSNPTAFLNTPVQGLLNKLLTGSSETDLLDFLVDEVIPVANTVMGTMNSLLSAHLSVPYLTDVLEALMEGRKLSLLRLGAFLAAIAKVLVLKVSAAARDGSATRQPVSFSSATDEVKSATWASFAFGLAFAVVELWRARLEYANAKATRDNRRKLDYLAGVLIAGHACCGFGQLKGHSKEAQGILSGQASCELIAAAIRSGFTWWHSIMPRESGEMFNLIAQMVVMAFEVGLTIAAGAEHVCDTNTEWAAFGLQVGATVSAQAATVIGKAVDAADASGGKLGPIAQVAFAGMSAISDLAMAGLEANSASD